MKIGILKERLEGENRVAIHPDIVKKYVELGFHICIEAGAGENSFISDSEFEKSGAQISKIPLEIVADSDIILKVQPSSFSAKKNSKELDEIVLMKPGSIIIGLLSPYNNPDLINKYKQANITSISMEFIPRITRAQGMDALSSQSNLSGYRGVIDAVYEYTKAIPMMTTAAGTIHPAKVMILGAGVAGLQAIATARRLGAIVSAFDVRTAAKEQVESLGANFIEVASTEDGSLVSGYAKEMSEEYKRKQSELIFETIKEQDIVISTALIPGKKAPILITSEMVKNMKPGSIIVDLAAINGGNCEETIPGKITFSNDIKIIGWENFPSRIANSASKLYANNLFNLVKFLIKDDKININFDDEIIKNSVLTFDGNIVHPSFQGI